MGEVFEGFALAMGAGLLMVLGGAGPAVPQRPAADHHPAVAAAVVGGVDRRAAAHQQAISMPVVIGILMLMGIVTKNAIMLVDFAIERGAAGHDPRTKRSSMPAASGPGRSS